MRAKSRIGIIAASGALFAIATALFAYLGYLRIFAGFADYDDVGLHARLASQFHIGSLSLRPDRGPVRTVQSPVANTRPSTLYSLCELR